MQKARHLGGVLTFVLFFIRCRALFPELKFLDDGPVAEDVLLGEVIEQ